MSQKRRLTMVVGSLAVCLLASGAFAGLREAVPIQMNPSQGWGDGALGDAHNANSSSQYFGCSLTATSGSTTLNAKCWVRNASFPESSCTAQTSSPISIQDVVFGPLLSLSGDSGAAIYWNPSTLTCIGLQVDNSSPRSQKNSGGSFAPAAFPAALVVSTSSRVAKGSLASARRIANNSTAYLGCKVTAHPGNPATVHCEAHDTSPATNPVQFCDSSQQAILDVVRTLRGDSYLEFHWPSSGHDCSSVTVVNDSRYQPNR